MPRKSGFCGVTLRKKVFHMVEDDDEDADEDEDVSDEDEDFDDEE